jgi:hypothetical protein
MIKVVGFGVRTPSANSLEAPVVVQFACHPEQALFAQRRACPELAEGIWASRAMCRSLP